LLAVDYITGTNGGTMRLARHVARIEEMSDTYNILIGKPERKIPFPRRRG